MPKAHPGPCIVDGCDKRSRRRLMCNGHYNRWHQGRESDEPLAQRAIRVPGVSDYERVMARVAVAGPDDCWEFTAGRTVRGYGRIGKADYAHRIVCEQQHGPAPDGKPYALHACDNPPCCNPGHLRWGDAAENTQDAIDRGRFPWSTQRS